MKPSAAPAPSEACALYLRRSAKSGDGRNHSIAEQEAECRALAARHGLAVVAVFAEKEGTGASRHSRKSRPQWERALRELDEGDRFETVIVWAIDRSTRLGADVLGALLTKHSTTGRRILGCDGTDTSDERQRILTILRGEVVREEADAIARRVARTKAHRRRAGAWLGGPAPFGLTIVDGKLAPHPDTEPIARSIAEDALAGETVWAITKRLNEQGVPSPTGGSWRVNSVLQLLRSPGFAGLQSIRRRTASGGWAAIADVFTDPETREPVSVGQGIITPSERSRILAHLDARTTEHARGKRRGRKDSSTLCGPFLRCAACGGLAAISGAGSNRSYRCATSAQGLPCPAPFSASESSVDAAVAQRFRSYLAALDPEDEQLHAVAERWTQHVNPTEGADRALVQEQLAALDADLARARRLAVSGILTEEEAAEELARLRQLRAKATDELATLGSSVLDLSPLLDLALSTDAWDALPVRERRALLALVIESVEVSRALGRGHRFNPSERLTITWRA